jgi:signal peptidase II
MKIRRITWAAYGLALVIIVLDQLTKAWMLEGLSLREVGRVLIGPPILNFTYVENTGVSFGLFGGGGTMRWVLSEFSLVVAGVLTWWALKAERRLLVAAIGLVIGGAIGNAIDGIQFGYVVDFIDFSGTGLFPWVFNVADSAITVGVILLILDSLVSERKAGVGAANEKA